MKIKFLLIPIFCTFSTIAISSVCNLTLQDTVDRQDVIAKVNNDTISQQEYTASLQILARDRFYHFEAPEAQEESFRKEALDILISDRLLTAYAIKQFQFSFNETEIDLLQAQLESQFEDDNRFTNEVRKQVLNFYLCTEKRNQIVNQLKLKVFTDVEISKGDIQNYYTKHPEKFTTPVQNNLGLILIGVEASMPQKNWQEAKLKAQQLHLTLVEGGDFSALAKEHSSDISARHGGDMGFQHQGMLGDFIEKRLGDMLPGDIAEPVYLLEGWAIIKLIERIEPQLNPLDSVKDRAKSLLLVEHQESQWKELVDSLTKDASITIYNDAYDLK